MRKINWSIVNTQEEIEYFLNSTEHLAWDSETTGVVYGSRILGISFYSKELNNSIFIPNGEFFEGGLTIKSIRDALQSLPTKKGIAHNSKFDWNIFSYWKMPTPIKWQDTCLMCHAYNPDNLKKLETRVKEDLGVDKQTFESLIGKKWHRIDWSKEAEELLPTLAEYACEDVYYTYKLYEYYKPFFEEDEKLKNLLEKIEYPLVGVLVSMYQKGITIDVPILNKMEGVIALEKERLTDEIYTKSGCVFNLNSGVQKAEVLFDTLGYPPIKATKGGARSTDSSVLEELAAKGYEVPKYLLEYSEINKLDSGYVKSIPELVDIDGRLRCNFNSDGTKTGRFSSNNPNLQNQPNNKKFPIRRSFVAGRGNKLLIADYSQIELRVMAHVSKDERFCNAFNNGEDIHGAVASDLGIERKHAKIVNFGVLYGMGYQKLAGSLGVSERAAKEIIENYESTYTGYYEWKTRTEKIAQRKGEIRTLFGRVRRLPDASTSKSYLLYAALRQSVNTVIQGSAADIIKLAMIKLHNEWREKDIPAYLLLQVHDELVCEAENKYAEEAYDTMKRCMEDVVKLIIPLEVDGKICTDWSQMKDDTFKTLYGQKLINQNRIYPLWLLNN